MLCFYPRVCEKKVSYLSEVRHNTDTKIFWAAKEPGNTVIYSQSDMLLYHHGACFYVHLCEGVSWASK